MSNSNHGSYRSDIDGLRAVAVLAVVAYHAFPAKLTGGFVGVDIFFIISGYLISKVLLDGLQRGSLGMLDFYKRRVVRIFPALITVMLVTFAAGWYLLLPDEFHQLGSHLRGAALFSQNFVLWNESSYFDNTANSKPMLHLWSLAIEEQFYIVWPLLLALVFKRRWSFVVVAGTLALASFGINLVLAHTDPTADFYSPAARFWELMIGGFLAWTVIHQPQLLARRRNLQSAVGFTAILCAVVCLDSTVAFPGWWALLPTIGAALLIGAGPEAWLNKHVLSNRLVVWFGLVSYPLYLWHWPVLTMLRIVGGDVPSARSRIGAIALSVGLAWLTYRFIEKPIRFGRAFRWPVPILATGMAAIFCIGVVTHMGLYNPRNSAPGLDMVISALGDREFPQHLKRMVVAPKGVYYLNSENANTTLFIGDSHIEHYSPRIIQTIERSEGRANSVIFATAGGCPPIPEVYLVAGDCDVARSFGYSMIDRPEVAAVVVGGCWNCYFIKQNDDSYYALQDGAPLSLKNAEGIELASLKLEHQMKAMIRDDKKVYLILDNPSGPEFNPRSLLNGSRLDQVVGIESAPSVTIDERQLRLRERMTAMARRLNIETLDPFTMDCVGHECAKLHVDGRPIFSDDNHFRPYYVREYAGFVDKTLFPPPTGLASLPPTASR